MVGSEISPLWDSGGRKEAMELLRHLWPILDDADRQGLIAALLEGPPARSSPNVDPAEEEAARARRIFDRLIALERLDQPRLPPQLAERLQQIREAYPGWDAPEGEEADFAIYMETRDLAPRGWEGPDLGGLEPDALERVLVEQEGDRDGMLDAWAPLAKDKPELARQLLMRLSAREDGGPVDVWRRTLPALRSAQEDGGVAVVPLLGGAPAALFEDLEFARAAVDVLEEVRQSEPTLDADFWRLWDRLFDAVEKDPTNSDEPDNDWVGLAINRPLGKLAGAFFNGVFRRRPAAGAGIPQDLRRRLDALIGDRRCDHRVARVIAVSRLAYLFAIDPQWTQSYLVPLLDWEVDQEEALAAWQAYAWQPRINVELWSALKPHFLRLLQEDRLLRIGAMRRSLVQLLMLASLEFDLGTEQTRDALRALDDDGRSEALYWVWQHLRQRSDPTDADQDPRSDASGTLWRGRIQPWLRRVWPREAELRSQATAVRLAEIALVAGSAFPEAVHFVTPLMATPQPLGLVYELSQTDHPDRHPAASLDLLAAAQDLQQLFHGRELRELLNRIVHADPTLHGAPNFRRFDEALRARGL